MYDMFSDLASSAASRLESVGRSTGIRAQQPAATPYNLDIPRVTVKGPPPASKKAIRNLNIVQVTSDDLIEESNKECLICLDEQKIGSTSCKLACGHLYHQRCLTEWLQKSCTCEYCYPSRCSPILSVCSFACCYEWFLTRKTSPFVCDIYHL